MKNLLIYFAVALSAPVFAGVIGSGGTPPAKSMELLLQDLMNQAPGSGGVFESDAGELGLGFRGTLNPGLRINIDPAQSDIAMSEADFLKLSLRKKTIDAVSTDGAIRSYRIERGDVLNSFLLKDRREHMRAGLVDSTSFQ